MIKGDLVQRMEELLADRVPFVTATVVRAAKPTSVRPGDAAIVLADGTIEGFVGGVCAQASVRLHAARVLETGEAVLLRLFPGAGEDRRSGRRRRRRAQPVPERRLAGDLPRPAPGRAAGADRGRDADRARAGGRRARRGLHGLARRRDRPAAVRRRARRGLARRRRGGSRCARALEAGVGLRRAGRSPQRGAAVLESLDVDDALRALVHTPAGLDIGARAPADIAISILAQMVAERTAHAPGCRRAGAGTHGGRPGLRHAGHGQRGDAEPLRRRRARVLLLRGLPLDLRRGACPRGLAAWCLAAGGSSRLGQPKQLLPFGDATLLDHMLGVARACGFDQLVCVLGGGAAEVRSVVD